MLKALLKFVRKYRRPADLRSLALIAVGLVGLVSFGYSYFAPHFREIQQLHCIPLTSNEVRAVRASEPFERCNHTDFTLNNGVADTEFNTILKLLAATPAMQTIPGLVDYTKPFDVLMIYEKANPSIVVVGLKLIKRTQPTDIRRLVQTGFIVTSPGGNRRVLTWYPPGYDAATWESKFSIIIQTGSRLGEYDLVPQAEQPRAYNIAVLQFAKSYPREVQSAIDKLPGLKIGSTVSVGDRVMSIGYAQAKWQEDYDLLHQPYVSLGVVTETGTQNNASLAQVKQHLEAGYFGSPVFNSAGEVTAIVSQLSRECWAPPGLDRCWSMDSLNASALALLPYLGDPPGR